MTRCGRVLRQRVCEFIRRKNSLRWASRTTKTDRKNTLMHIKEGKRNRPLQPRCNYRNWLSCSIWCGSSFSSLGNAEASWIYSERLYHGRWAAKAGAPYPDAGLSTVILFFVYPNTGIFYWNFCKNLVISLFSMISASVKMCLVLVVVLCGHIVSVCK